MEDTTLTECDFIVNEEIGWDIIKEWKISTDGKMNEAIENPEANKKLAIKFHSTLEIKCNNEHVYKFPTLNLKHYVYKNLRFNTKQDNIKECSLNVISSGDNLIMDSIPESMFNVLRHLYDIHDETVIPFSFCRDNEYIIAGSYDISVNITSKHSHEGEPTNLVVDIYEVCDDDYNRNNGYMNVITQLHTCKYSKVVANNNNYGFQLKASICPVNYIIIDTNGKKITDIHLLFNEVNSLIPITNMYSFDAKYIFALNKSLGLEDAKLYSINLGKIADVRVIIETNEPLNSAYDVNIYTLEYNVLSTEYHLSICS